jgi:hypothetical protein
VRNDEPGPQPRLVRWIGSGDEAGFPALGSVFAVPVHMGEPDVEVDVAVVVDVLGGDGVLIPPRRRLCELGLLTSASLRVEFPPRPN